MLACGAINRQARFGDQAEFLELCGARSAGEDVVAVPANINQDGAIYLQSAHHTPPASGKLFHAGPRMNVETLRAFDLELKKVREVGRHLTIGDIGL